MNIGHFQLICAAPVNQKRREARSEIYLAPQTGFELEAFWLTQNSLDYSAQQSHAHVTGSAHRVGWHQRAYHRRRNGTTRALNLLSLGGLDFAYVEGPTLRFPVRTGFSRVPIRAGFSGLGIGWRLNQSATCWKRASSRSTALVKA
jgi:hypothetical protein